MIDVLAHNHAPDETWVLEWLSSPRLQTYLDASGKGTICSAPSGCTNGISILDRP